MPLPSNIQDNIEKDAEKYFVNTPSPSVIYAYIAGATTYSEQVNKLAKALKEFISMHETGLLPNRFTYLKGKEALADWEKGGGV